MPKLYLPIPTYTYLNILSMKEAILALTLLMLSLVGTKNQAQQNVSSFSASSSEVSSVSSTDSSDAVSCEPNDVMLKTELLALPSSPLVIILETRQWLQVFTLGCSCLAYYKTESWTPLTLYFTGMLLHICGEITYIVLNRDPHAIIKLHVDRLQ